MSFQDKSLQCADCGATFTFSVQDQEFFAQKGYTNEPKRCPSCRTARKSERTGSGSYSSGGYGSPRQMFPATCAQCGKSTEVPFQPRGDKPVYCSDCYRKVRPAR
ncbi:MAG: zinc-ribbon domain containing protein [Dehalococcoidales bacterium]|nr:zinc-ribbon domain containing protein [Dehalococcoidales bacterium]